MSVSFLLLLSSFACYSTYCAMQVTVHVQHMHTHTYCHTGCTHTHTQCVRVAGHLEQSQCLSTVLHTVHVVYSTLECTHTCMTYIRTRYIQCTQGTWCVCGWLPGTVPCACAQFLRGTRLCDRTPPPAGTRPGPGDRSEVTSNTPWHCEI